MPTPTKFVPNWLVGMWHRDYIRRADANGTLGAPQSAVQVCYIQTPYSFVDVRRQLGTQQDAMAFAGVTTVVDGTTDPSASPLVRWHACLDMTDPVSDPAERWELADRNKPKATPDEGYFEKLDDELFRETDPAKTLEEQWERQHDGSKRFLAARRGTTLFVMAGDSFGFASQGSNESEDDPAQFLAGSTEEWKVLISPTHLELEGSTFCLPGKLDDWQVLPGSNVQLESLTISVQHS